MLGLREVGERQCNYRYHICPGTCNERLPVGDSEFLRNPQKRLVSVNIHRVWRTALPSLPGVLKPQSEREEWKARRGVEAGGSNHACLPHCRLPELQQA